MSEDPNDYLTADDVIKFLAPYNRGKYSEEQMRTFVTQAEKEQFGDDMLMTIALTLAQDDKELEEIKEVLIYYMAAQLKRAKDN